MIETQYIDIFNQNRAVIDKHSVAGLNSLRDRALKAFEEEGFPTKKLEDYLYIDVADKFKTEYGLNLHRVPFKGNPYKTLACSVPGLSTYLYFMLNDLFHKEFTPAVEYPKGVFVGSINDFALQYPEIFAKHYGQTAHLDDNGVVAFNTMFVQDGFVVYVPKNVVIEKPIQLINVLKSTHDYLVNRRILVIAEENAQVKIVTCDHTMDDSKFLATQVTEIFVGDNARVDFYELEENSDNATRLANTFVHQGKNSYVLVNNIRLRSGSTRNNYHVKLAGEHADAYVCGLVIADGKQYADNFAFLEHAVPNCHSTQLFKYVLQGDAIGAFCGRIIVARDAQKTLAYQSNNNLCISPTSRMYSKPQLEIYADDVKCSHGLTTGELDEEALFYLRARGINEETAKLMLMHAFAAQVLEHVHIDELKDHLLDLVEKRLRGEDASCSKCTLYK